MIYKDFFFFHLVDEIAVAHVALRLGAPDTFSGKVKKVRLRVPENIFVILSNFFQGQNMDTLKLIAADGAATVAAATGIGSYLAYAQGTVTILGGVAAIVLALTTAAYWRGRLAIETQKAEEERIRLDAYVKFVLEGGDHEDILSRILNDDKLLHSLQEHLDRRHEERRH